MNQSKLKPKNYAPEIFFGTDVPLQINNQHFPDISYCSLLQCKFNRISLNCQQLQTKEISK